MKRITLYILVSLFCSVLMAQQKLSFSVLEFEQDVFDTSAKSAEHGKKDGNGSWYAIIKVTSNNPDDDITDCQFNFGNMASKVEKRDEALWVYVQRNAKKVTISRPGYHTISQYDLQTTIEAGANYKMVLTSDRVQQQVVYDVKMQMVKFVVSPAINGAMITVTNESTGQKEPFGVTASNGVVSKALSFGRYSYEVLAQDNLYYPTEGIITINSSDDVFTENVVLRPHFADITLTVENEADIYINNEHKGKGQWIGRLSSGTFIVTCKKENHRDSQQKLVVEDGVSQNVTLVNPSPITGVLTINTVPTDATISIDGNNYGKSPKIVKDLLIGSHDITIALGGYKTEKKKILIEEGKIVDIDLTLQKGTSISITKPEAGVRGIINGHEYVDLGLPSCTMWATCNVGAFAETDDGNYFAWGETKQKSNYTESDYTYKDNPTMLPTERDAASVNWGDSWKTPTHKQIQELSKVCTWTFTTINGKNGFKVSSNKNSNYIFLPEAGFARADSIDGQNTKGQYLSSTLSENSNDAWTCYFYSGSYTNHMYIPDSRYAGYSVRPVFCADFAEISLQVENEAEIYIDNEIVGKGKWCGRLSSGTHTISCKKENHKDSQQEIVVKAGVAKSLRLTPPTPITGTLILNTKPQGVSISIDGRIYGKTPKTINILVGNHEIEFSLVGYQPVKRNIIVEESKQSSIDLQLEIEKPEGMENGHRYVDLGLPSGTLWADCNIGASSPSDCGDYFAWGETSPKSTYSKTNYSVPDYSYNLDKSEYDAAYVNWGDSWRMPETEEYRELIKECKWQKTTLNGRKGYKVSSKKNNSFIFFPAAGEYIDDSIHSNNESGYYWFSMLNANYFYFRSGKINIAGVIGFQYRGCPIRPVLNKKKQIKLN